MPRKPEPLPTAKEALFATAANASPAAPQAFASAMEELRRNADVTSQPLAAGHRAVPGSSKQGVSRTMTNAEQIARFHHGNVEAMMKSGQIWAAGLQDMSQHFAQHAQRTMEETLASFRAVTAVKSVREAFELQSGHATQAMEKVVSEASALTERGLKLAEQAAAPLTARVQAAVEVFAPRA